MAKTPTTRKRINREYIYSQNRPEDKKQLRKGFAIQYKHYLIYNTRFSYTTIAK